MAGRRILASWFAACLCTLALATARGSEAQTNAPIRIATVAIDMGAEVLYANDLGSFKKAGLDVAISVMNSGSAVAAAVAGGSADIGQSNPVSVANAHEAGLPFVVLAAAGYYSSRAPTTEIIVARDSPIKTARDLSGHVIAVAGLKDITEVGASAWLDQNGGDTHSVKFTEIPQSSTCAALTSGRADAGVISEPNLSVAVASGCRVLAACHDAIAKQFVAGVWFSSGAWAKEHPDAVRRFRAVLTETAKWANANHQESGRILEKYLKFTTPSGMNRVTYAERLDPAEIQPLIDAAVKYGTVKSALNAADLLAIPS